MTSKPYVSPADAAKTIRTALKAAGIPARAVSVRSDSYSGGSSIRVEIKAEGVDFPTVEKIANAQESIDRDGFGEILSGGNRYVTVTVAREVIDAGAAACVLTADGCIHYRGRKACPLFDGERRIGWHLPEWKGWRLESDRSVIEAICQMPAAAT